MIHTPPSPRMQFLARNKRTRLFNRHSAIVYSDTVVLPCIVNRRHDHASVMHDINSLSSDIPRSPNSTLSHWFQAGITLLHGYLAVTDKFISYH